MNMERIFKTLMSMAGAALMLAACNESPKNATSTDEPEAFAEEQNEPVAAPAKAQTLADINAENLPVVKPNHVWLMPSDKELKEWNELNEQAENEDADLPENVWARYEELGENPVLEELYSDKCSWYCGGEVKKVTASSYLKAQGKNTYKPENAHNFNHESVWAEGAEGQGIGEWLDYEFEGKCPRVTGVEVITGHVKTQSAWTENSRPKFLKVYYLGKPICILALEDKRAMQYFDLEEFGPFGYHDETKPSWHLRFEILDVYPGTKYADTVIAELMFDGIDVH